MWMDKYAWRDKVILKEYVKEWAVSKNTDILKEYWWEIGEVYVRLVV